MAALAAGTSLPWVAGFAVPDIFAAVLAMAVTLIFLHRDQLRRWEFWGVWGLILASVVFHSSHLLIALGLIVVGLLIGWMAKAPWRTQKHSTGMVLGACAAAMALSWIYSTAIQQTTGDEFRRPPFLIARVLADGPGRAYLRYSCAKGADWEICRFKNLPLNKSDDILWSSKKELGVFNRSNYEQRVRMEKQEFSFVLHTIEYDPWGQFSASMNNWNAQFMRFWVDDPLRKARRLPQAQVLGRDQPGGPDARGGSLRQARRAVRAQGDNHPAGRRRREGADRRPDPVRHRRLPEARLPPRLDGAGVVAALRPRRGGHPDDRRGDRDQRCGLRNLFRTLPALPRPG